MRLLASALLLALPLLPAAPARVSVMGSGTVQVYPNQADISFRIESTRPTMKDALATSQAAVRSVYALCARYASDSSDLGAGQIQVERQYRWIKDTEVFQGFQAIQIVNLRLKDLNGLGPLLEASASVKLARIAGINYLHGSQDSLERAAEALALANARRAAETLASGSGGTLGEILEVRNFPPAWDSPQNGGMDGLMAPARAAGGAGFESKSAGFLVKPGQLEVRALVSAAYTLGSLRGK